MARPCRLPDADPAPDVGTFREVWRGRFRGLLYQWNVDNRPTTFDTITLIHDALGRIVEKNNSGAYNQYVYDSSGQKLATMNGATLFKALVSLPGGIQAVFSPTAAFYRVPDWLGSARIISSSTRTYNTSEAFAPFGEKYALGGSAPFVDSFTGMTNSTVSNEYDFPARSLHPGQGRWISPDPAGLGAVDLSNPQTWNRYAYVGNNPTGVVDPLGLQVRQIECVGCNLNGDLGCDLTASCTNYVDEFGMQVDSALARQLLRMNAAATVPFGSQARIGLFGEIQYFQQGHDPYLSCTPGVPCAGVVGHWVNASTIAANNGTLPNGDVPIYGLNGQGAAILATAGREAAHDLNCAGAGWAVQGGSVAASGAVLSTGTKLGGATSGTSVASATARTLAVDVGTSVPTPVGIPFTESFAWRSTSMLGGIIGRYAPYVGQIIGAVLFNQCVSHP